MIFSRLRECLPEDSVFRIPLVFHLSWVLALKLALLLLLWQLAFKPLLGQPQAPVTQQLGLLSSAPVAAQASSSAPTPPLKDASHD